jgi:hypothetical protein
VNAKEAIDKYKEWYTELYGVKPSEKLIETFCKMKGIDIEKIRDPERKEVAKVEDKKQHSVLINVPVVTNETTDFTNHQSEENYKALETNYHNLLAEHQEVCAIAHEQSDKIEKLEVKTDILASNLAGILKVMAKHRSLILSMPDEFKTDLLNELETAEKYVNVEGLKNGHVGSAESTEQA